MKRGYFTIRTSFFQPYQIWSNLIPSLAALKQARYFGRAYDGSDVNYARKLLRGFDTLDYRAYELTHFQTPHMSFTYVENLNEAADKLKEKGFSQCKRGRVAILPKEGAFTNEIERVYLDCLANGGRSTMDAIAIELMYDDQLTTKGVFPIDLVEKVKQELPNREP